MNTQVRELQVTPIPTTAEGPSTVGSGAVWGFARSVGARLLPWLVPVALVVFWQVASSLGWLSTRVLPAPVDVVKAFWTLTLSGELWTHVKVSAGRALAGGVEMMSRVPFSVSP